MMIPEYVATVLDALCKKGYNAFVVGGCVRDSLLGKEPSDWDVTTNALPEEIIKVFGEDHTVPTGIKHGTIGVKTPLGLIEVTTFRIDGGYTDFRHPVEVMFSTTIADDLMRRDFTINAMAYSHQTGLIDNFGGRLDLEQKVIRAVGDPTLRFNEDALRIMRGLRFAATLGFDIEEKTALAIRRLYPNLKHIANERITSEFLKLILAENPVKTLMDFKEVFEFLFDGELPLWQENVKLLKNAFSSIPVRLALLFENFQVLPNFLVLPADTAKKVRLLLENKSTPLHADRIYIKKLLSVLGCDVFELLLKFRYAKGELLDEIAKIYNSILAKGECFRLCDLKISGEDILKETNFTGPQVGSALKELLEAVIEEKCENTKEELIEYLKRPN